MHKLAVGIGCFLLLLAAILLAGEADAASSGMSGQRLRVQQVLAESAPCVTCHSAVSDTPRLELETGWAGSTSLAASPLISNVHNQPNIKEENAHENDQRRMIGARLLAVPTRDLAEYTAAVEEFVAASQALDQAETVTAQQEALLALDAVARRLLALEQRANPYQLRGATGVPASDTDLADSAPPAPPPLAVLTISAIAILPRLLAVRRRVAETWIRPPRFVRGGRRRGPPCGEGRRMFSVGRGRLRLWQARSLFSSVRRLSIGKVA